MSFYIKLLIILGACSISSAFISNIYAVESTQNHFSMFGQRCFDDSCTMTTCFNNNPCQTTTEPNPNRSSSSSPDNVEEEDDDSGSFFDNLFPW